MWLVAATIVLAFSGNSASAEHFYQPGFKYELKGAEAKHSVTGASQLGTFVFVQVGASHISAVNAESATERWRFTSKNNAIRRMHNRKTFLLVEAEDLVALDPGTGQKKWEFPLNCHSEAVCNTRIRALDPRAIVLSGFDKRNDNIMLVDAQTGQRQWPSWVEVPEAKYLIYTPNTIVVATADKPYAILGLDRYTGRRRWQFRPGGTESSAAGLLHSGNVVTIWWEGRLANEVYSVDLETGNQIANWPVTKRARSSNDTIGGGRGFFYSYQPSYFGAGGSLKVWNASTGDLVRRKRFKDLVAAPTVRGGLMYMWFRSGARLQLQVVGALDGKERWRYQRRGVQRYEMVFDGAYLVLRLVGNHASVVYLNALTGKILGAGVLTEKNHITARFSTTNRRIFLMAGPTLVRLEPEPAGSLLVRFEQFVANGQVDEAEALHDLIRPFTDELPTAAKIHRRVVGQSYKAMAARLSAGGFAAIFPTLLRLAADEHMLYFEDFRSFLLHVEQQLAASDLNTKLTRGDTKRVILFSKRLVELLKRYQRKLVDLADPVFFKANRQIFFHLAKVLTRNRQLKEAQQLLVNLWDRTWCIRGEAHVAFLRRLILPNVKSMLPRLGTAVARGKGQDQALLTLLEIPGINIVIKHAPKPDNIPEMTPSEYAAHLARFRAAVKQRH